MNTILKSLAAIVAVGAIAGGATFAYFTDSKTFNHNKLTAGTVAISVDKPQGALPIDITGLAPGDETEVRLDVENTGNLDIKVNGTVSGIWDGLNEDHFMKVAKVQYKNSSNKWITVADLSNLPVVTENAILSIKLFVKFDLAADNIYQGKTYRASVNVNAVQADNYGEISDDPIVYEER